MERGKPVAVQIRNACKNYGTKKILDHLNMSVEKGTIYGLLGASGCGKTTLLSCIVGRKKLNSGALWVLGGEPGTRESGVPGSRVGYMPQDVALVAEFTVKAAIYYFGRIFGMNEESIEEKYQSLSRLLDLPPSDRFLKDCSGGQQRRISFAAAMVSTPELLILDEPTVGLDPVLRERIWNYLVEITHKNNVSVIITTHYIEETRQAHKIGLMRQGKLLAEESPDVLMNTFQTNSLEDVFLYLSRRQTEGRLHEVFPDSITDYSFCSINRTTSTVSITLPDLNNSRDVLTPKTLNNKKMNFIEKRLNISPYRLRALFEKNWMQVARNYSGITFMILFPILEILAFFLAVGNDVRNIKMAVINDEDILGNCSNYSHATSVMLFEEFNCTFSQLGCRFLEVVKDPMIDLIPYEDIHKAIESITHGEITGAMYIHKNFSHSLEDRINLGREISTRALNSSQIETWMDMSNRQIGTTIKFKLIDKIQQFQKSILEQCNYLVKLGDIPIRFEKDIYGHIGETFRVFMTPGVMLTIMFFLGTINTSSIIITDRLEGVWDRSIVAGVSSIEILLTHLFTQLLIVIMQAMIVIFLTFAIYRTEFIGNFGLIVLLTILQGACGMAYGLLVSVISNSHSMAHIVTTGSFFPMILICGLVWPLEGMPIALQWVAKCMPFTIPIISLRNVIKKGWNLMHLEVLNGIGIELLWIILFGVISGLELRRKR